MTKRERKYHSDRKRTRKYWQGVRESIMKRIESGEEMPLLVPVFWGVNDWEK